MKLSTSKKAICQPKICKQTVRVPIPGGNSSESERKAAMEANVNAYIAACEAKAVLLQSKIAYLRRAAMVACLKAVFCKNSKEELIRELVENNIESRPDMVHRFLNARFFCFLSKERPARSLDPAKRY